MLHPRMDIFQGLQRNRRFGNGGRFSSVLKRFYAHDISAFNVQKNGPHVAAILAHWDFRVRQTAIA
jgi:hypothetical protein